MPVELHPHQVEAVEKLHNGCILYGGVGVGKTITSLGYYFEKVCGGTINAWGSMQTPKDVYVITTAKVRDSKGFELQAAQYGVHEDPAISTNGVKITVDSWNNLHKYVEVQNAFFIFDEQRVVGYGAWARAFIKIAKHNEWILLSATPGDTWLDYIPVFIANGWYKHKTDFLDQHVIWTPRVKYPKVLRYQNVGVLVRRRNEVLVHMPYERHTVRHPVYINCDYDEGKFERVTKKRWHVYENRPLRDVAELFSVMRKVVNSDTSRLDHLRGLMQKHPKLIVFYNFDYELEMLRTLVPDDQLASPESIRDLKRNLDTSNGLPTRSKASTSTTIESGGLQQTGPALTQSPRRLLKHTKSSTTGRTSENDPTSTASIAASSTSSLSSQKQPGTNPSTDSVSLSSGPQNQSRSESTFGLSSGESSKTSSTSNSKTGSGSESKSTFAIAEWNGHKHEEIPATERWLYLVQYRAGAEGWNCVDTDAIVFWSQTYSYRDWWQAHGRIDRLNTKFTDLYYYHFVSKSPIDKAIRAALRVKKNFNERDLVL